MESIMTLVWFVFLILAVIAEAATTALVAIWFFPGAFVAMILAFFHVHLAWQIAAFLVLSAVSLMFGRKVCKRFFPKVKTNTDALIGKTAVITEEVHNLEGKGAAKIEGKEWSARADRDDIVLTVGEYVEIVDIQGVKLICRKR